MLDLENPPITRLNVLNPHAWFLPYSNSDFSAQEYPFNSSRTQSLNGIWRFDKRPIF